MRVALNTATFAEAISRARAAVISAATSSSVPPVAPAKQASSKRENSSRASSLRFLEPLVSRKTLEVPNPTVKPYQPFASSEAVQASKKLSKGAQRLWELLHALATSTASEKGYSKHVSQVVYSLPQSLVAMALGYTDRHVRNLQTELEFSGLLDSSPLAAKVDGQNLYSTTLWAVKVATSTNTPRLHPEEFQFKGHRDFAADLKSGNTVLALKKKISGLQPDEEVDYLYIIRNFFSVKRFELPKPVISFSPEKRFRSLQDTIYTLPLLVDCDYRERPKLVSALSSALAHALKDHHSQSWYAKILWEALAAEDAGIPAIQPLSALLSRLSVDRREWTDIRNAGSLFASRVRGGAARGRVSL